MNIIACGIDQGLANLGYSIVEIHINEHNIEENLQILKSGTFKTSSEEELGKRLLNIHTMITELNSNYNTNIIGSETLFFNPKQKTGRNKSASIMVTNMVSGIIFLIAGQKGTYSKGFTPGTVKKYVAGSGRATKDEVIEAVSQICKNQGIIPKTEHEADAIAIGITTARYYINKLLPELINQALQLVDKAENRIMSNNYINAFNVVNKLPNCCEKESLMNRLKTVFNILVDKSLQLVIKTEKKPTNKNYENAIKTIKKLPDSNKKTYLCNRLFNLHIKESE